MTPAQRQGVMEQVEADVRTICQCKLDQKAADQYLLERSALIKNGKLETEYAKWTAKQFAIKPILEVRKVERYDKVIVYKAN